jgi:hypothetical protein
VANETVRVFVEDQELPTANPIENVLVKVFDSTGATFITQDYTDVLGIADFTLDGDDPANEYQIRLSKTGVAFDGALGDDSKSPQLIEVYSPPANAPNGNNDFTVQGQTFVRPTASDPLMCKVSGHFKRGDGLAYPNLDVIFTPLFKPAIVSDAGIMGGQIVTRTDDDGYIEIDLYRNGEYSVSVETLDDYPIKIYIPDLSSFNLAHLLFPVVSQVVFDPTSASITVGEEKEVETTVTASDNRVLDGTAAGDVEYEVDDESVATVSVLNDNLVITGVSAGTTQIDVSRRDESVVIVPDSGIVYSPLTITVS